METTPLDGVAGHGCLYDYAALDWFGLGLIFLVLVFALIPRLCLAADPDRWSAPPTPLILVKGPNLAIAHAPGSGRSGQVEAPSTGSANIPLPSRDTPGPEIPTVEAPTSLEAGPIRTSNGNNIYFAHGAIQLTDSAMGLISRHAERLLANPRLVVTLCGYAENFSSSSYSIALGQLRAQAVRDQLLALKVATSQIRITSFGHETFPSGPCLTELCRASYRRVEFRYPNAERGK